MRRCANAAVDAALDESLRDALDARLGLKDEMAACGLAEGELPLAFGSSRRPRRQPKKKKRKKAPGPARLADPLTASKLAALLPRAPPCVSLVSYRASAACCAQISVLDATVSDYGFSYWTAAACGKCGAPNITN